MLWWPSIVKQVLIDSASRATLGSLSHLRQGAEVVSVVAVEAAACLLAISGRRFVGRLVESLLVACLARRGCLRPHGGRHLQIQS